MNRGLIIKKTKSTNIWALIDNVPSTGIVNKIFYVEAHIEEWRCSPPIHEDIDFFYIGKDIDDVKARFERANYSLTRIDYNKIEEVSGDERHIGLINDAIEELNAEKKMCLALINILVEIKKELRDSKQWKPADRIRNRLNEFGVVINDGVN